MQRFLLNRKEDVNNISGCGIVWEGVIFDNGWIAGKWLSKMPSYGWYPSLECVRKIHGHGGRTEIQESEFGELIYIMTKPEYTTDGNPYVAQGYICINGWIALLHLSKWTSVYWYRNEKELQTIIGERSEIREIESFSNVPYFPSDHVIWEREFIYTDVSNI